MWLKSDESALQKELAFNELYNECLNAASGAPLSYGTCSRLELFHPQDRKEIVSRVKEGCAPLLVACRKGNVEIVKYLIDQCEADVEQRGVYEKLWVEDIVTPLQCASAEGKLSVVRCLVEHGANVNSVSDMGRTPACYACLWENGLYEIVVYLVENNADILKPDYNGATCLMLSYHNDYLCDFLIKHGADVNRQNNEGETALHYAISEYKFKTTKLLLDNGANPFIRRMYGDDALRTACLTHYTKIFYYICQKYTYTRERMAEAHELLGSAFLEERGFDLQKCLHHWRIALDLRYNTADPLPKNCVSKYPYSYIKEFTSLVELENYSMNLDVMYFQSLLVCERILGPLHSEMISRLISRALAFEHSLQYQCCFNLRRYVVELEIQKDCLLCSEVRFAVGVMVEWLLQFYVKSSLRMLHEQIQFDDVFESIRLLVGPIEESKDLLRVNPVFNQQQDDFDDILQALTHLIFVLYVIPKTPEQLRGMQQLLRDILRLEVRTCTGDTLLHLVVSRSSNYVYSRISAAMFPNSITQATIFPNSGFVELFLECGANVEVANYNLSTPLHIASLISNFNSEIIQMLLNYGAHIDRRNDKGNRPDCMLQSNPECTVNYFRYTTLKCLAARKVIEKQVSYSGEVPANLEDFIGMH